MDKLQTSSPKSKNRTPVVALLVGVVFVAATWGIRAALYDAPTIDPNLETGARLSATFIPGEELDRLIAAYERRITETETPSNYILLGQFYLEKARVTGDLARYVQAGVAFQRGQDLRPEDPIPEVGLAQTDLALHRFEEALNRVAGLSRLDAVAVAVDAQIALGELDGAERSLDILGIGAEDAGPILVRRSQIAWMRGEVASALRLAMAAVNPDEPNLARRAWFEAFAAQMAFQAGDHETALQLAEQAVVNDPDSIGALAVLARSSVAAGDLERAEELLIDATTPVPEPAMLDELGDIQTALGKIDEADATYSTIDVIATLSEAAEAYDRSVARSLADRGVDTARAVQIAEGELDIRRDALTLDTLAWALFRDGRLEEAWDYAKQALETGIRDASILYHSAEIAAGRGEDSQALDLVRAALEMNNYFDLLLREDAFELESRLAS